MKFPVNEAIKVLLQKTGVTQTASSVRESMFETCMNRNARCHTVCVLYSVAAQCYSCACSSRTRCRRAYTILAIRGLDTSAGAESQLHSNKISRTGRGRGGVFWVLNNAKRGEEILLFVCLACRDPERIKRQVRDKGRGKKMWFHTKTMNAGQNATGSYLL